MLKNKKAQLGEILADFPVLIFVILIGIIFIFAAGFSSIFKPSTPNPVSISTENTNLLLQSIEINYENNVKKEILVLDAVSEKLNNRINTNALLNSLASSVKGNNKCAIVFTGKEYYLAYLLPADNKVRTDTLESSDKLFNTLETLHYNLRMQDSPQTSVAFLTINNEKVKVMAYMGKCTE